MPAMIGDHLLQISNSTVMFISRGLRVAPLEAERVEFTGSNVPGVRLRRR